MSKLWTGSVWPWRTSTTLFYTVQTCLQQPKLLPKSSYARSVCTSQNPLRFTFITPPTLWFRSATMWPLQSALSSLIGLELNCGSSTEEHLQLASKVANELTNAARSHEGNGWSSRTAAIHQEEDAPGELPFIVWEAKLPRRGFPLDNCWMARCSSHDSPCHRVPRRHAMIDETWKEKPIRRRKQTADLLQQLLSLHLLGVS